MDEKDTTQPNPAPEAESNPPAADPPAVPESVSEVNGSTEPAKPKEEEVNNAPEPSPAPESSSASISSVDPDMLGDEIVVGTRPNGERLSPNRPTPGREDEEMTDAPGADPAPHYPKRKRSVLYADLGEDSMENHIIKEDEDMAAPARIPLPKRPGNASVKGVIIGYWRDSTVPNDEGKHAVIGFMDVRERLRTRIQMQTTSGQPINARLFPIPPGPGGSWVTFERIVFLDHLVGMDHNVIKEYVKIRGPNTVTDKSPTEVKKADEEAVEEAKNYLEKYPPPETPQPPPIAWGKDIPEYAQSTRDPQFKRRRTGETVGTVSASPVPLAAQIPVLQQQPQHSQPPVSQHTVAPPTVLEPIPGTRPTRILVGCWGKSDAPLDKDKHAVYGILGANDMFRVKLVRETMDGRFVDGNFPTGAGALWIPYEEVTFLPHLQGLTRPEMKEYVRVRQAQIDAGETDVERIANETKAVYEAQTRAAANPKSGSSQVIVPRHHVESHDPDAANDGTKGPELRQSRREQLAQQNDARHARYSLPEADIREMNRQANMEHFERQRGIVDRAMTRMENNQERDDRYAANRAAMSTPPIPSQDPRRDFQDNIQRMQKVWVAQENTRMRVNQDDSKFHNGVKYERRQNGPFAGKLVSQGTIISIDGEDYVEYRVLTKPSFF